MPDFRAGQIIPLRYESREIKAIIIDPNGLGPDKPSLGMGFRGMDRERGIPQTTLSRRVMQIEGEKYLELPYAQAYTILKRAYTYEDDQRGQGWIMSRESGKPARADWGWEVQGYDCIAVGAGLSGLVATRSP